MSNHLAATREPYESSHSDLAPRRSSAGPPSPQWRRALRTSVSTPATNGTTTPPHTVEVSSLLESVLRSWYWLILGAIAFGYFGWHASQLLWQPRFTASAQLVRHEPPVATEAFRPRVVSTPTLVGMIQSPELMYRVGSQLHPPLTANELATRLLIIPERESEITVIEASAGDLPTAIGLANLFAREAVEFTRDIQQNEAREADQYVTHELTEVQASITRLREELRASLNASIAALIEAARSPLDGGAGLSGADGSGRLITREELALQEAREELASRLSRYTDAHPLVREQRARIEALLFQYTNRLAFVAAIDPEATPVNVTNNTHDPGLELPAGLYSPFEFSQRSADEELLVDQIRTLEADRGLLAGRQRVLNLFLSEPPGYFRLFLPATAEDAIVDTNQLEIGFFTIFCAIVGALAAGFMMLLVELFDSQLKTAGDVKRITRLPLLASVGKLRRLTAGEQENWAFRAWTAVQSRLAIPPEYGAVCGLISAHKGEGSSTWTQLLLQGAVQRGFRLVTITTTNTTTANSPTKNNRARSKPALAPGSIPITPEVLIDPGQITESLDAPDARLNLHIPLPSWEWDPEYRRLWQAAIQEWSQLERILILVDLPPASAPEAILLAEALPNLLWITRSGKASAAETRAHLDTLRSAGCNVVGAVLNREPAPPLKDRFTRWTGLALILANLASTSASAGPPEPPVPLPEPPLSFSPVTPTIADLSQPTPGPLTVPTDFPAPAVAPSKPAATNSLPSAGGSETNSVPPTEDLPLFDPDVAPDQTAAPGIGIGGFSIISPEQRAAWQQQLTLGPGDTLNLGLYGEPELSIEDVPIGPDGRISYLEAHNVLAAGLTVDDFRESLNNALAEYRRAPKAIVVPMTIRSKRYSVMGTVVEEGVYLLDRPVTVLEAVARARGFETELRDRSLVELADLSQSILARDGQRVPVDFQRLFLAGDLNHNVALEPGDYLYFPPAQRQEIYVVGEVGMPGVLPYRKNTGALESIAVRGGFNSRAYKKRVLVVRGSLDQPQTFVVNTKHVLNGQTNDFRLEPRDIVFVARRPWLVAEELLDAAATAFLEAVVVTATGIHVGPIINRGND